MELKQLAEVSSFVSAQQNGNTVSRVINELLPSTCTQMHEYFKRAIHFILNEVPPLPTGEALAKIEMQGKFIVNNWSLEMAEDSELSNLQEAFKNGAVLKTSYYSKDAKRRSRAEELMANLDDRSFDDVLKDIEDPKYIFTGECERYKSAAQTFCQVKMQEMVEEHVKTNVLDRRIDEFKVQFEPAVRICMTLPPYVEM